MRLVHLEKDFSIKVSSVMGTYINPEHVYIPMPFGYSLRVKFNEVVFKGQVILENDSGISINSSISGKVVGVKDCTNSFGKVQKCIVVENDFKENFKKRPGTKRIINELSKEELIRKIEDNGVTDFSKPYSMLHKTFRKKTMIKNIVFNGIDIEPYVASESFVLRNYTDELLEMLDALNDIIKPDNLFLVLKSSDGENIDKLNNLIGTYPKIKLKIVPDAYPIGNDIVLLNYLFNKNVNYDESLVLSATNTYAVYNAIKRNRQLTERMVTISGNGIKNPQVFNMKIGALVMPLVQDQIELKSEKKLRYYANGLMTGTEVKIDELIVTNDMTSLIINEEEHRESDPCISCGKCFESCPININPKFIMDNIDSDVVLMRSKKESCIACGLCSYVCPAKIKLNKYVRGDKCE